MNTNARNIRLLKIGGWLLFFFLPILARCYIESYVALSRARTALAQAEYRQATDLYVLAIRWRAPLNVFASQALDELEELMVTESIEDKIYALTQMRRALFSARSFYYAITQKSPEILKIDQQLRELGARVENTVVKVEPLTVSYSKQALVQVCFFGWILAVFLLIWRGFNNRGEITLKLAVIFGLSGIAFFLLWLVALTLA